MSIVWVTRAVVLAIHEEQLAEHGGATGGFDEGLLDSALARPRNLQGYGDPSLAELAAAYAFGISRDHPFMDGNKRVSFVVTLLFLVLNGFDIHASDAECALVWQDLAAGGMSEARLARWIQDRLTPAPRAGG